MPKSTLKPKIVAGKRRIHTILPATLVRDAQSLIAATKPQFKSLSHLCEVLLTERVSAWKATKKS